MFVCSCFVFPGLVLEKALQLQRALVMLFSLVVLQISSFYGNKQSTLKHLGHCGFVYKQHKVLWFEFYLWLIKL